MPLPSWKIARRDPDESAVEQLVQAGLRGMEDVATSYSAQELLSAALTLALRIIDANIQTNPQIVPAVRAGVQVLLLHCTDGRPN